MRVKIKAEFPSVAGGIHFGARYLVMLVIIGASRVATAQQLHSLSDRLPSARHEPYLDRIPSSNQKVYYRPDHQMQHTAQQEYEIRKEYYKARVADYYRRLLQLEKSEEEREKAAAQFKLERKRRAEQYERARQEQVRARKAQPPEKPNAFIQELKLRAEIREQQRRDYVQRRENLERLTRHLETIPENEELGINIDYEKEQTE